MKEKNNMQFCLLSALGIFFVVDGHLNNSYLDIGGLIPYYSFHMPLFVFISGYFLKPNEAHSSVLAYMGRKFRRLMIPYLIWNLIYGVTAQILRTFGFSFGKPISFYTLFVEPFQEGYQFILNHAAWFVPTLFLTEMIHFLLIKYTNLVSYLRFLICLALGIGGIFIARHTPVSGFLLMAVRVMFLLPFLDLGLLYQERLEAKDKLKSPVYFSVILFIAMALVLSGKRLIYAVSFCNDFTGYLLPYISACLGIAFWLRAARILAPAFEKSAIMKFWGRNTFSIMMHHIMVFLIINTGFALAAKYTHLFPGFLFDSYKTDIYYCFFPRALPQWRVFYLILAIALPLCFQKVLLFLSARFKKLQRL